jgi:hypothetical protein
MRREVIRWVLAVLAVCATAMPLRAHHSFAMFDLDRFITLKGTVTEFHWINPHAHIILQVSAGPGIEPSWVGEWDIESASVVTMAAQGWTKAALKPGDSIAVRANPLRNGEKGASLFYVTLANGNRIYRDVARPAPGVE